MQITFLGAARAVTGSKYLLNINSKKILVDCGLYQGHKELRLRNWAKLPVDPREIHAVILTHAHIDHTGYIPLLIKNGFEGKIYCTQGTRDLCAILLPDSGYLQEEDAALANRLGYSKHKPALPLYTKEDGINALKQFVTFDFNEPHTLFNQLEFRFFPAGHIIRYALVQLICGQKKILFTGDLGRPHDLVMKPPAQVKETDYLIAESTYGDRLHDKTDPLDQLQEAINSTVAKHGNIIIPAFAGVENRIFYICFICSKRLIVSLKYQSI